eukprot:6207652-Pleurochrysis_carterae.AAC.3
MPSFNSWFYMSRIYTPLPLKKGQGELTRVFLAERPSLTATSQSGGDLIGFLIYDRQYQIRGAETLASDVPIGCRNVGPTNYHKDFVWFCMKHAAEAQDRL